MNQKKIYSYLLYALGEILLVVIGILIALQVNNWNEERKNREVIQSIFSGIQEDLFNDIREAEYIENWYAERDSMIRGLLTNQFTANDLQNPENQLLYQAGIYWYPFAINKSSFEALNIHKEKVPVEYQELVKKLNDLYGQVGLLLETAQTYMKDHVEDYRTYLYDEKEWILDYRDRKYTDQISSYFLDDNLHKRKLARYRELSDNIRQSLKNVQRLSIINYLLIHSEITHNQPLPAYFDDIDFQLPNEKSFSVEGTYNYPSSDFSINIENHEGVFIANMYSPNIINDQSYLLTDMPGDTTGSTAGQFKIIFERADNRTVTGLTLIQTNRYDLLLEKQDE